MISRVVHRRARWLAALALLAGAAPAAAREKLATPESVGMSSERLARIAPAMQDLVDREKIPGAVFVVDATAGEDPVSARELDARVAAYHEDFEPGGCIAQ